MTDPRVDALYYLRNFQVAMAWLGELYPDLLSGPERAFIEQFQSLPETAQALVVRLLMRKGDCFRGTKVRYPEIGEIGAAAAPLIRGHFLDDQPLLTLAELFELLRREEIDALFPTPAARSLTKAELLDVLQPQHLHPRTFQSWRQSQEECAYRVIVAPLCTRLQLLFFGSFHQDWSEFVLVDLGIFKYEHVALDARSRGFQSRDDIESFYRIHACRELLYREAPLEEVHSAVPAKPINIGWLEARRAKLLFEIAHRYERLGDVASALSIYGQSPYPGARLRRIRLLERAGLYGEALEAATAAHERPESAAELQGLGRIMPRLYRQVGIETRSRRPPAVPCIELILDAGDLRVEEAARRQLESEETSVFYVENALVTSVFGLLFWDALFEPVPGAFFHPFHSAPMDLYDADFVQRRSDLIAACFQQLEGDAYLTTIRANYRAKYGISSAFVAWGRVNESLLELALQCVPVAHWRLLFQRLLEDLRDHTTGLPDLIQFWPQACRYELIEVKGPGDRLQDHQQRWIRFLMAHEVPVRVAHVRWTEAAA